MKRTILILVIAVFTSTVYCQSSRRTTNSTSTTRTERSSNNSETTKSTDRKSNSTANRTTGSSSDRTSGRSSSQNSQSVNTGNRNTTTRDNSGSTRSNNSSTRTNNTSTRTNNTTTHTNSTNTRTNNTNSVNSQRTNSANSTSAYRTSTNRRSSANYHSAHSHTNSGHVDSRHQTTHYVYRQPANVTIVWTAEMQRNYVRMYPNHRWSYNYGYRIVSIPAYNAGYYIGDVRNVYGVITEVYYEAATDEYFLGIGPNYPYQYFTIIVPGYMARSYSNNPYRYYMNRNIGVTGLITTYEGKPEILVRENTQLYLY